MCALNVAEMGRDLWEVESQMRRVEEGDVTIASFIKLECVGEAEPAWMSVCSSSFNQRVTVVHPGYGRAV